VRAADPANLQRLDRGRRKTVRDVVAGTLKLRQQNASIRDGTRLDPAGCATKLPGLSATSRASPKSGDDMIRSLCLASTILILAAALAVPASARERHSRSYDANGNLDLLIAKYASENGVPESLVRRVIKRESGGNPRVVSRGNFGLMQIKLATARSLGYSGGAAGLLDAETNMNYAVKYLAGAYRVAGGNADRAVHYYAAGYYYAAKSRGLAAAPAHDTAMASFASLKHAPAAQSETAGFASSSPGGMNFH
jgi:hypothetical protein